MDKPKKILPTASTKNSTDTRVARRIKALNQVLSRASVGNFSTNIKLPAKEDEFTEVFVGVQVMLEVIREKIAEFEHLKQDLESKVAERTKALELLQSITAQAAGTATIREAYQWTLKLICAHMKWPVGHVYEVDSEFELPLRSTNIWHIDSGKSARFEVFRKFTEATHLKSGLGLPGNAYRRGRPMWMPDVTTNALFARPKAAKVSGVAAGFAFPVRADGEIVAILEFFTVENVAPEPVFMEMIATLGTQLGSSIDRIRAGTQIRASEEHLRTLTAAASDAIISANDRGCIMSWNHGAQKMFGYTEKEALDEPMQLLMPERFKQAHALGMKRVRKTGKSKLVGSTVELVGRRKDGTEFPIELSLSRWQTEEGTFFTGIIRNITERKRAEEKLRAYTAELEGLNQVMVGRELKMIALKEELAMLKRAKRN